MWGDQLIRLLPSTQVLNISKDKGTTTSLDILSQCSVSLTLKQLLLYLKGISGISICAHCLLDQISSATQYQWKVSTSVCFNLSCATYQLHNTKSGEPFELNISHPEQVFTVREDGVATFVPTEMQSLTRWMLKYLIHRMLEVTWT